ncbi:MAG: L,D-transpeptidase [Actinobacteria bacterium]|nr:L,D-transpeptidase [Actinomycetota bacterium]
MIAVSTTPLTSPCSCSIRRPGRRWGRAVVVALAVVLGPAVGAGCSPGGPSPSTAGPGTVEPVPTSMVPNRAAPSDRVAARGSVVVRSDVDLDVHDRPDGAVVRTLPASNGFGSPLALLVVGSEEGWAEVLLPGRPTGATGWVRADGVELRTVDLEVRVDLAERRLVLLEEGEVVLETAVAVGAPDAPTPTGRFSLTDKIASADPDGAYGPFALGLSARSEVFSEFGGGDGQIAIHGTDDPGSIGQAVSHGCVRVPDDVVRVLNERLPLGTPVVIS